ncbi:MULTISPECIES: general stress protein [Thermomonospora]|uniref:Putative membrane protein n=1 Tax=Thermomonospora cellulosilytica TaxID=1411118 RepID=A0A7W3RC44_9ACTN|nr:MULTISPECIES: general stress protein [Thermomonospora]MBA9008038.1 putative membrane protein [Thermomonospora cellulosilytica]
MVTTPPLNRTLLRTEPIATFTDYAGAQQAVDRLSDLQFPVEHAVIVGADLRLVEQVLGRLTVLRATLSGAASGAWFGLLIGLFFAIFTPGGLSWLGVILAGLVWGAVAGALFGAVSHALTGGHRDFVSRSSFVASTYEVRVDSEYAARARDLLESGATP